MTMMTHQASRVTFLVPALALGLAVTLPLAGPVRLDALPAAIRASLPALSLAMMMGAVFTALVHAEIIAARLGEPIGTLILTLCVTAIEVTIVVSLMLHDTNNPTLARESVFSVVMIVCTGLVGLCLLIGALRHGEPTFQQQGASDFLAVLMAISVMTLVLPDFTITTEFGTFSHGQLALVSVLSILLYGSFLFIQTVRHRQNFLDTGAPAHAQEHRPTRAAAVASLGGLVMGLTGIVLLAERVAAAVETGVADLHLAKPDAVVGALLATLVLLPEGIAAVRAANKNALQTSLNIALGSAVATIGLTIPAVGFVSLFTGNEIVLGLELRNVILLFLTLGLSTVTLGTGRINLLTGFVHLSIFVAFVFLLFVP